MHFYLLAFVLKISPVKIKGALILLLILFSLLPAYYINLWLQKVIQPRRSFLQFLLYMFSCFALVFVYTFLVTSLIFKIFPVPRQ